MTRRKKKPEIPVKPREFGMRIVDNELQILPIADEKEWMRQRTQRVRSAKKKRKAKKDAKKLKRKHKTKEKTLRGFDDDHGERV